jgi:hypothetical protein
LTQPFLLFVEVIDLLSQIGVLFLESVDTVVKFVDMVLELIDHLDQLVVGGRCC